MQKRYHFLFTSTLLVIFFSSSIIASPGIKKKIELGGLFSITGGWNTLGRSSAAAIQLAVEDVNAYFDRIGSSYQVDAIVEDTQLDPKIALTKLQDLSAQNVHIVIGPQSSAEVANIKDFAQQHDILILSQSSTAGSLSIPGDNVFRLCPDDDLEGEAVSALMYDDGIRVIVPIWRDDAGNNGLHDATKKHFEGLGGTVSAGVQYAASTTDFTAAVNDLSTQLTTALSGTPANQVAVYLAGFDEVVSLFQLASVNSTLKSVKWYGSDGVALSNAVLNDSTAADFANLQDYPNPTFGLDAAAEPIWKDVAGRIQAITGFAPDAFALGVYDAVWIAARTAALAKGNVSADFVRNALPEFAGSYFGGTGWTVLNEAGDRRFGNFDYWAIRVVNNNFEWKRVATYNSASKEIIRFP